jgi:protein subunit release factor A
MANLIRDEDLKVEAVDNRPRGGQHVGYTSLPVKVTHIPTGISATVEMRSQHRSRQIAVEMIEAALTSPNFR